MTTDLNWYTDLRQTLKERGYGAEWEWSQNLKPVSTALDFWIGFAWVVLNSGMKNQIAEQIRTKVHPAVIAGGSAASVFGHKGKAEAIDYVYANRDLLFQQYKDAKDKLSFLRSRPWIGGITCFHLAKDLGLDCAKPDRHLVRIAGDEGAHELCARLAKESGDRISTVDLIIWRSANLGLI